MERINSNLFLEKNVNQVTRLSNFKLRFFINYVLSILCSFYVFFKGGWGMYFHWYIVKKATIAFFKKRMSLVELNEIAIAPLDSFRYFEFHFGYAFIKDLDIDSYLDISSPRYFPAYLIEKKKLQNAVLINPDKKDIANTNELYQKLGLGGNAVLINELIENVELQPESFDLITSISVLEHIPLEYILNCIEQILNLLKPGGHLLISIPVAKKSFEEYINYNEYGLQDKTNDGYYFGQRFHDSQLIDELFISTLGQPLKIKIVGEKINGFFINNRFEKLNYINYPSRAESLIFNKNYAIYDTIDSLPGLGVAIFLFQKRVKS